MADVVALVDDLFFQAKMLETARQVAQSGSSGAPGFRSAGYRFAIHCAVPGIN